MRVKRHLPLYAAILVIAAGCASEGPFPSLAPRPIERAFDAPEPDEADAPAAADPALAERIAAALTDVRAGQDAFEAELGVARPRIAAAGSAGSDSWIEAQQALSRLEGARAPTVQALALLDRMVVERAEAGLTPVDFEAIEAAITEAHGIAESQREEIARLAAKLSAL